MLPKFVSCNTLHMNMLVGGGLHQKHTRKGKNKLQMSKSCLYIQRKSQHSLLHPNLFSISEAYSHFRCILHPLLLWFCDGSLQSSLPACATMIKVTNCLPQNRHQLKAISALQDQSVHSDSESPKTQLHGKLKFLRSQP